MSEHPRNWALGFQDDWRIHKLVSGAVKLGADFSGIGLVFCNRGNVVPHMRIYTDVADDRALDPVSLILSRSHKDNDHHDGFHILDPDWSPICLSAFLSPDLASHPLANPYNRGSRWLAARLTSRSPKVLACFTIGHAGKFPTLFIDGQVEHVWRDQAAKA
ncbi:MAG: hypothetical protein AAGH17_03050 [Pseudomonadota bacterium]